MKHPVALLAGLSVLSFLLCAGAAPAEMYKWIDKDGALHVTDYPPPGGGAPMNLESIRINRLESGAPRGAAAQGASARQTPPPSSPWAAPRPGDSPRVEVYGTTWCAACRQARDFFRSAGISFADYDVEKDEDARARMQRLGGGPAIPAIVIGRQVMRGFSREWCEMALGIR